MCIHARSDDRETSQKSAYAIAIGSRNQKLIRAMQYMQDNLEEPLELFEIASRVMISKRQLERLLSDTSGRAQAGSILTSGYQEHTHF